jgi:hypothetical protein
MDGVETWASGRQVEKRRQAERFEGQWEIGETADKSESTWSLVGLAVMRNASEPVVVNLREDTWKLEMRSPQRKCARFVPANPKRNSRYKTIPQRQRFGIVEAAPSSGGESSTRRGSRFYGRRQHSLTRRAKLWYEAYT